MKKLIFIVALFAALSFSCEIFTSSLGEWATRDLSDTLKDSSASDIATMLTTQTLSSSDAKAVINALSTKSSEELNSLTDTQKATIVSTATAAIIPDMSSLVSSLDIEGLIDGTASDTEGMLSDLFETFVNSIDTDVNTDVLTALFGNDDTVTEMAENDSITLALGTVALVASVVSQDENVSIDSLQTKVEDIIADIDDESIDQDTAIVNIGAALGATAEESAAIFNAIEALANTDMDFGGLI